jgi:hypothetical protein
MVNVFVQANLIKLFSFIYIILILIKMYAINAQKIVFVMQQVVILVY